MTDEFTYTPEQALARSILLTAVNGGINRTGPACTASASTARPSRSAPRASTPSMTARCGTSTSTTSRRSITKLIEHPAQCADPESSIDFEQLHAVGESLADARTAGAHRHRRHPGVPGPTHADKIPGSSPTSSSRSPSPTR